MATSTELKNQITTDIINKTLPKSISKQNVGENMKDIVDYVDQEVSALEATVTALEDTVADLETTIDPLPYTSYVAIVNQTGTNAPIDTVIYNNTGRTFTYFYGTVGIYGVNIGGSTIPDNKTVVITSHNGLPLNDITKVVKSNGSNIIDIYSGTHSTTPEITVANSLITNLTVEIRIYN